MQFWSLRDNPAIAVMLSYVNLVLFSSIDSDVKLAEEEAVTTTTFSSDVKVPSNEETNL